MSKQITDETLFDALQSIALSGYGDKTTQTAITALQRIRDLLAERDRILAFTAKKEMERSEECAEAFRAGAEAMREAIACAAETIEDGGSYILSDMIRALPFPAHQSTGNET